MSPVETRTSGRVMVDVLPGPGELSLFERIGGAPRVAWIAERLDERIRGVAGLGSTFESVPRTPLKQEFARFITRALGGPFPGGSSDELEVRVGTDDLMKIVWTLLGTIHELEIPEEEISNVFGAILQASLQG